MLLAPKVSVLEVSFQDQPCYLMCMFVDASAAAALSLAWCMPPLRIVERPSLADHCLWPLQRTKSTTLGTKLVVPKPVNLPSKKKVSRGYLVLSSR